MSNAKEFALENTALKANELELNKATEVKLLDEGEKKKGQNNSVYMQFKIVDAKGIDRVLNVNQNQVDKLINKWGEETRAWKLKTIRLTHIQKNVQGKTFEVFEIEPID